jgi:CRISPR/Cas system CSM-associated protein Csm3 (group 7 of RAMP superfamily)
MMIKGALIAESPIYRGNARKTLFTRDGDGKQRLVSLAGEIGGTAQALMDAFVGESRNGRNIGLLNQLWRRLYGEDMPRDLVRDVSCTLREDSYPGDKFFDLRMGIKLDEDRWAAEANANYKMETVLRNSVFDFRMTVNEAEFNRNDNLNKLYYALEEIKAERFWFGAGKSKGVGRVRLEANFPLKGPFPPPKLQGGANHLQLAFSIGAENPIRVGWNWGKVDPLAPAFNAADGKQLVAGMTLLPEPVRVRLEMSLAGPVLKPEEWKAKFQEFLPRTAAIWLKDEASGEKTSHVLPSAALKKLGKGKHGLGKKLIGQLEPLADQPFSSKKKATEAIESALSEKPNMVKRVLKSLETQTRETSELGDELWETLTESLKVDPSHRDRINKSLGDEAALMAALSDALAPGAADLTMQVDQQLQLLTSDTWVDQEIESRREHLQIKTMIRDGQIAEAMWNNPDTPPEGISAAGWKAFLAEHQKVAFRHMTNARNLAKSIVNDRNQMEFLESYRAATRRELSRPANIDFRRGGPSNREISKEYGKPYDTVFMRMLSFRSSARKEAHWEIYIPGSTVKGAFRRRCSQMLKTIWGETPETRNVVERLFGAQGRRGLIFFSDACLVDPDRQDEAWASLDGVRMDPRSGQPVESAKRDCLFAYGDHLHFRLRIDLADIRHQDRDALTVFFHLLRDFQTGEIPLGGGKTGGMGWVAARPRRLRWLTGPEKKVHQMLFGDRPTEEMGIWQGLELEDEAAAEALAPTDEIRAEKDEAGGRLHVAPEGFISHRQFGGHCGRLRVRAELLTPLHIAESGEPSHCVRLDDGPVNGFDFFSMSPPEAAARPEAREYAVPAGSVKGMLRHLYSAAVDARETSPDIRRLNGTDQLFGWVGTGPNQALMGRLSFDFGRFENPSLSWWKAPYPYGGWHFAGGGWHFEEGRRARELRVADHWRFFPHAPVAPAAEAMDAFAPDTAQAGYFRAMAPGTTATFDIRFWNLTDGEFRRLLWCILLEPGLAHKMGGHRYLGFGSLRMTLAPESHTIDWNRRYRGGDEAQWRRPVSDAEALAAKAEVHHQDQLRKVLDASVL